MILKTTKKIVWEDPEGIWRRVNDMGVSLPYIKMYNKIIIKSSIDTQIERSMEYNKKYKK